MIFDAVLDSDLQKVRQLSRVQCAFTTFTETKITFIDLHAMKFIYENTRMKVYGPNSEPPSSNKQTQNIFSNHEVYI